VISGAELQLYSVNNITTGHRFAGRGDCAAEEERPHRQRRGADTDIVVASARLHQRAQQLHSKLERLNPQV